MDFILGVLFYLLDVLVLLFFDEVLDVFYDLFSCFVVVLTDFPVDCVYVCYNSCFRFFEMVVVFD